MTSTRIKIRTRTRKRKRINKKIIKSKRNKKAKQYTRKHSHKYKTYRGGSTPEVSPLSPGTSPYYSHGKGVVSVSKLQGKGRAHGLPHEQQIHSTGDRILNKSKSFSPYKIISAYPPPAYPPPAYPLPEYPPPEYPPPSTFYPPPLYPPPPSPPDVALTSKGRLKTTYTPTHNVVDLNAKPFTLDSGIEIPRYVSRPLKYTPKVILPLSYLPLRGNIYELLSQNERTMLDTISRYHEEYSYLSPYIYNVLETLNLTKQFGIILIWGKLCDDLMENIRISSIKSLQSRTLLSEEDTKAFLSDIEEFSNIIINDIGPTPSDPDNDWPYELKFFQMPTPKHELHPTSLQVVGYNTHPIYNQYLSPYDISNLVQMSEANKRVIGKETIFISAHGAIGKELSPELKLLANKYLRVIELGKKHNVLLVKYASFFLELNRILLNPGNAVMFENTDVGEKRRKEIFDKLCHYLDVNKFSTCLMKDTLSLTELTHDRVFQGHFTDSDMQEDHDINMHTLIHYYSMGIFKPVEYKKKTNRLHLFKKKIFELYPGTTFATKNTTFELVKTLLPIAVRENKVMNVVIYSCAVEYRPENYFQNPNTFYKQPSDRTPAMKLLVQGKKFIFSVGRMISFFVHAFFQDPVSRFDVILVDDKYVYNKTFEYFPEGGNQDLKNVDNLEEHLNTFYLKTYIYFLQEIGDLFYSAIFSFAGVDEDNMSYSLIEDGSPSASIPYVNEVIKVKIYLMQELYRMFRLQVDYCLAITRDITIAFTENLNLESNDENTLESISNFLDINNIINNFFIRLKSYITYIEEGFYGNKNTSPPIEPLFLQFPKYIEVKKEYDDSNVQQLYDEINEGMDYSKYRRDIPDANGITMEQYFPVPLKGLMANTMPPGEFHHIARNTYKYKEIPNVDKAKGRIRTFKANKAKKLKNGSFIEKTMGSYHISV